MVHGSIIGSRLTFVEQRWGSAFRQYLIDKLPIKERKQIKNSIFENRWFEFSILDLIDNTIRDEMAEGDREILHELGRFSADYNYHRLPASLISLPPVEMLKNSFRIKALFQDFGDFQLDYMNRIDNLMTASLVYRYPPEISHNYCKSALGYLERLMELSGYNVVAIKETHCQSRGDNEHRYKLAWDITPVNTRADQKFETKPSVTIDKKQKGTKSTAIREYTVKAGKGKSYKVPKALDQLTKSARILIVLILLAATIGSWQLLFSLPSKADMTSDKIHFYHCRGNLHPVIRVDRPYLLIKTDNAWTQVKIITFGSTANYVYTAKQMMAGATFEIGLGEFLNLKNRPLNQDGMDRVPENFSISAIVNGEQRSCSCRME
jgi:hypothetical protein